MFAAEGWFLCRHVVAMFPEVFSIVKSNTARVVHQVDFPYAHADSSDAHECAISRVQEFVTSDDVPTVAFVSASGHPPFASKFFRQSRSALAMARLGGGIAKAIFLTTDRSHFEKRDLPPNALHVNYLPLTACVDGRVRLSALVYHGTIGCAAARLRSAMKHVVVPAAFDQHHNAALLSRLNVARVIPMHRLTSKYWLARSNKLCEAESMHRTAKTVAQRIRGDPRARVADIIANALAQSTH